MYLYMFYLGGNAGRSNIEVHDIQFVVTKSPKEAWPILRNVWFGDKDKVHIDGYMRITWVGGYDITLSEKPSNNRLKLFFVNVGAYEVSSLAELHAFDLYIAESSKEAKEQALSCLLNGAIQQHKDNLKEVDDCLLLEKIGDYYIHLEKNSDGCRDLPEWQGYQPIGI